MRTPLIAFLSTAVSLLHFNCSTAEHGHSTAPNAPTVSYSDYLDSLNTQKSRIDSGDYGAGAHLLFDVIHHKMFAYWHGTTWDFNGTTQTPGKGEIACGYFLTTVMKHTGFDIKRVWMAQQASSVLIKAYCSNINTSNSLDKVKQYLSKQPDNSVFIVGLDSHTGFVTKKGSEYYLIHSNYIGREGVVKEKLDDAQVLNHNSFFMIGNVSQNRPVIQQWMNW